MQGLTIKDEAQIALMRKSGQIVEEVLHLMERMAAPGISTLALDEAAHNFIRERGAEPSFLNYRGYPASICTSINEEVVHGIPSARTLIDGDILSVDVGACLDGWHSDAARTFLIGNVSAEVERLVRVTKECFYKGLQYAYEGFRVGDISFAIQEHAEANGYGVVRELVGHGIGRSMHEQPDVPNFGAKGHGLRLIAGMTIAIEPMINMGSAAVSVLSDGWTVIASDRKPSAHYENTIAITKGAPLLLTKSPDAVSRGGGS